MGQKELFYFLENIDRDPSKLIFEDELTGLYNRRFFLNYLKHEVPWDIPESRPTSLLMMDLDYFKEINDTYGHDVGDKVLIWVGRMARKICGDKGMVIRYGGDEFMILMPSTDKEEAIRVGEQLIQQPHKEPFCLSEVGGDIHITLSIGVASVPDDATDSKSLIQKVDTALYHAKRFGRDQISSADQVDLQGVFPKAALHQLDNAKIIGRRTQLFKIAEALKKFGQRQNQFLIVEGADGMGKSEFLGAIQQSLSNNKIWQISVSAAPQEMFRPYYIMTNILHEMLKQQPDKGKEILENMSPKEANYLSYILHQAKKPEDISPQEDGKTLREHIFNTIVYFFLTLLDSKPLVLLIDDLHFCDKATLILIRKLLLGREIPFFICGTATDIRLDKVQGELTPLEQFLGAFSQELSISRTKLTPLTAEDIADYFQKIFPNVMLPENFEEVLAKATQGNPLFISGILRKLVLDEKITLDGQKWVVQPLEDGYLPKSLEEVVSQKIAAIDKEGRQLLDHAATLGENISLSVLAGSSESIESKVLEFVDQAVVQGLISVRSLINDETIHFLSRRVLDIIYGNIQEDQKQELHERIGTYQEVLHFQHLLPSASTIAYHFQLSANRDKARIYRESQEKYNDKIFNLLEALHYTEGDLDNADQEGDIPLDPASMSQIPGVIHALLTAVRNTQLYPPGSRAVVSPTERLKENIFKILIDNQRLNITQTDKTLMVNGEAADFTGFKPIADAFVKFLSRLELAGITFSRGLKEKELTMMIESFSRINMKVVDPNFWHHLSKERRLFHIDLNQVRYTDIGRREEGVEDQIISDENGITDSMPDFSQLFANDAQRLDEQELEQLTKVIRCLLTSASNIKLYPPESKIIIRSIEDLKKALDNILIRRDSFALARIDEGLLVNGMKIDTTDFKAIAESFIDLMTRIGLNSLTFLKHTSTQDLTTFISALGKYADKELNGEFWRNYSRDQKTSSIVLDQHFYGILEDTIATGSGQIGHIGEKVIETKADLSSQIALRQKEKEAELEAPLDDDRVQLTEGFLISVEKQLNDLFLKGEEKKSYQLLEQLFQNFTEQTLQIRIKIINICLNLLKNLAHTSQSWVVKQITDPLKIVLKKDKHPDFLKEISVLLTETTANLIRFGEYQCVTQFYAHFAQHLQELKESKDYQTRNLKIALIQELNEETQEILLGDLKSQDTLRQKHATRLLSIIGLAALQFLISVIKKEDDLRLRQIASHLLKNLGSEAAESIKRELVLAGFAEERFRILEVVDIITRDIKTELAYALSDESSKVRNAAFRLMERMNDEVLTSLLLDYAIHENSSIAMAAIKSLGRLKPKGSIELLSSLINSAKDAKRLIACCRALGQIADPAGIEPLAKLMVPGSFFTSRKRKNPLVRATAAFALAQISHPRVAEVFFLYQEDRDPRVRQSARDYLKTVNIT